MRKLSVALFVVMSACAGSGGTTVEMTADQRFEPAELTVTAGETISFKNTSSETHTVTAYDEGLPEGAGYFSSGGLPSEEAARENLAAALIARGATYELTLEQPGTYRYFCIPHEDAGMKGTIVVEP